MDFQIFFSMLIFRSLFLDISRHVYLFTKFDFIELISYLLEGCIFYFMLYLFTAEFEISNDKLIVYSFFVKYLGP